MKTPESLAEYRAELARNVEADEEAAAGFAAKALELYRSAELGRAELAGIDRATQTHLAAQMKELDRRLVPRLAAGDC
jgi:hypothetical protein